MTSKNIAIVDPGSFILPYDYFYIKELSNQNYSVDFYCSSSKYNQDFLDACRCLPRVRVHEYKISSSVSARFLGVACYFKMLLDINSARHIYSYIHFQFSILFVLEFLFFLFWKSKLVFTIHDPIPHDSKSRMVFTLAIVAKISAKLVFPSNFTSADFQSRYELSEQVSSKCFIVQHGVMPLTATSDSTYAQPILERQIVFWGTVKPYKGVDVFLELCSDPKFPDFSFGIYGKWDISLFLLRDQMRKTNILIVDKFLSSDEIFDLFNGGNIFLLPYRGGSQSGVLYTLLHYGKPFICSDQGDLGEFMLDNELDSLCFSEHTAEAIHKCVHYLYNNFDDVLSKLSIVKKKYEWSLTMRGISRVYS